MRLDPTMFDPEVGREWRRFAPPDSFPEDVAAAREVLRASYERIAARPTAPRSGVAVENRTIPSLIDDHQIPVRIYRPDAAVNGRGLVSIHGGGFYLGDLDLDEESCHTWARDAGCVVVSVGYRLAPEHTFPVPLEDCYSALHWTAEQADELGIDRRRLGVGGGSAGGALAAGLALLARDRSGPEIALQMLLDPVLDASGDSPSTRALSDEDRRWCERGWERYLGAPYTEAPIYASPASAEDLRGLPPAYIGCAEFDSLRDEAMTYAQRLVNAGVSVELHLWPRVPHGFQFVVPDASLARRAFAEQTEAIVRVLG